MPPSTAPWEMMRDPRTTSYWPIVSGASGQLKAGGWLLLEHGFQQGSTVRDMLRDAGFEQVATRPDLAGLDRVSGGQLHAQ